MKEKSFSGFYPYQGLNALGQLLLGLSKQSVTLTTSIKQSTMKPSIQIEYCPKCNWLLRSAYMAQEILYTFVEDVQSVTLIPSSTGGRFTISIDDGLIFDRKEYGGFPEIKELKQKVRDVVHPGKDLGHADKH